MNLVLTITNVIAFTALAVSALKYMDRNKVLPVPPRAMLLVLTFLALYAAIEALAWKQPMRPGETLAVIGCAAVASWKTFARLGACFLASVPPLSGRRQPSEPKPE